MSEAKLLPCPFCAGKKINWVDSINEYTPNVYIYEKYLQCDCCANRSVGVISSKPITEHGKEVLIEKWNTRKPINRIVERLEEDIKHTFDGCINKRYVIEIVNQLAEEHNNGWISCAKRMPEENKHILTTRYTDKELGYTQIDISRYVEGKYYVFDYHGGYVEIHDVIAWQPLPAPY